MELSREDWRYYWLKRLHSLTGIVPIGVFLIEHLLANSYAARSPEDYNHVIEFLRSTPFLLAVEIGLIIGPILFHGIYGLFIAFTASHNVGRHGYFRNWMYTLQRVSGIYALVFILWHLWHFRISEFLYGTPVNFERVQEVLASPVAFYGYFLGVLSTVFHFANGIWTFLITWGITISPASQRRAFYLSIAVFVILTYVGMVGLYAFR